MKTKITAGSRGSRLALIQAQLVKGLIERANPGMEIAIKKIATAGDRDRRTPLDMMSPDVFVKELEDALLRGSIDIAVHSLKDMPSEIPEGLCLLAVTERLNPADVLVSGSRRLKDLPAGARIGTSSLRRSAQLSRFRPDLAVRPIRGNIDTRLRKVASGDYAGVIMAAAALIRLGWQDQITEYLPLNPFLPAAGQGALAIEARQGDTEITSLIRPVNHLPTWRAITAERAFLEAFGGGCRAPVAALGTVNGDRLDLRAMVLSPDGREIRSASAEDGSLPPRELGVRLANEMLATGADRLIRGEELP